MFKKILIANRGEIAARIAMTCREMGIHAIALYEAPDIGSRHVRLADECALLASPQGFLDQEAILRIAHERGAEAIHPGYGFLAEEPGFAAACAAAGIAFVGPATAVLQTLRNKLETLARVRAAGFPVIDYAPVTFDEGDLNALDVTADLMGYPLIVKSCSGGRGAAERLVKTPEHLQETVKRAQVEAQMVFGNRRVYLEKAILPAHQIGVQILADKQGNIIHLGEREGSLQYSSRKVVEEAPAPSLTQEQREGMWKTAVAIARLFRYENAGTVEFLLDKAGNYYFTEIKARIQVEHTLTEMLTRVDLVEEQLRIAAGEPLRHSQESVRFDGWAMLCRVHAEDPWRRLANPGPLGRVRFPTGPEARIDTYVYSNCNVPARYDSLIAKLTVWGSGRESCLARTRRALEDFQITGTPTNLPLLQHVLCSREFGNGRYDTDSLTHEFRCDPQRETYFRDLAVIAAMLYVRRNQMFRPAVPPRTLNAWHRDSRRLPE